MQSEAPLTLLLSPLRAGRGELDRPRPGTPPNSCNIRPTSQPHTGKGGPMELDSGLGRSGKSSQPMAGPLSEFWAVEYHFNSDSFSVRPLPDYLTHAQTAARAGTLFDSVILDLHPSEQGAREECTAWQTIRATRPLMAQERLADLQFC